MYQNIVSPLAYNDIKGIVETVTRIPFYILYYENNEVLEYL